MPTTPPTTETEPTDETDLDSTRVTVIPTILANAGGVTVSYVE